MVSVPWPIAIIVIIFDYSLLVADRATICHRCFCQSCRLLLPLRTSPATTVPMNGRACEGCTQWWHLTVAIWHALKFRNATLGGCNSLSRPTDRPTNRVLAQRSEYLALPQEEPRVIRTLLLNRLNFLTILFLSSVRNEPTPVSKIS